MTNLTHGADVDRLRATAQQICEVAEELIAADIRTTGALAALTWNGPDAMRARQVWDTEHGPALVATARSLVEAGQQLLAEADQQQGVSAAGAAGAAPSVPATGDQGAEAGAATLPQTLSTLSVLLNSPKVYAALGRGLIGQVPDSVRSTIDAANFALDLNTIADTVAKGVPVPTAVAAPVAGAGAINDLDRFSTAVGTGDLDGALRSGGSLAGTAVGRVSPAHGAVISTLWNGTYWARDRWFTGSRFEENFVARNDAVADMIGPGAVPVGLGTFIVAGVETGWEKLTEVVTPQASEDPPGSGGGR